jgi:protein O-mannosyl-transferase
VLKNIRTAFKDNLTLTIALAITLLVYSRFLFFGHISWDDPEMVFKNEAVKEFDLKTLFSGHYVGNYIPLTMLVHALAWFLFENNDWGHHLINILLHLVNGWLVFKLGGSLFKNKNIATLSAVLFLLHPIQIESVGWISELKNILSTTFSLLALIQYLKYLETKKNTHYLLCFLFFILGCLSKSSIVVLPLCLIFTDILKNKTVSFKYFINKIPFLVLSVVFGLVNIQTQTADQFINHAHEFPYYQRVGFAGFALVKYTLLFLFPINLSVIYPYPEAKLAVFAIGYFMLCAIIVLIFFLFRKKNYTWLFILLFILFNLALVLQFLPFGEVLYADRYLYIPVIGFAWILGFFISKIKVSIVYLSVILIMVYGILTLSRVNTWKSAIVLYEDIIKKYPNQFIALNSAGVESMFLNDDTKALEYLNKAVEVAPRNYKGFYNRGLLFLKNQKPELAIKSFNQALALYDYAKAYTARASAYYMLGDLPKAMNDANIALQKEKDNAKAHFVLGNCYNDLNKLDDALAEYNRCITLNRKEPDFYFKRAIVFGKKQQFENCLGDLTICLELDPTYYEAYYWNGVAKMNLKQNPCGDFKIAAQHNYEPAINAFNKYCH